MTYGKELERKEQMLRDHHRNVMFNNNEEIELENSKPGPIENFKIVDMDPQYTQSLHQLHSLVPNTWIHHLKDWRKMTLRDDIKESVDYQLVS